ncbi:gliding motility lipoprotein GldH [Polaribacter glomeratus]|uniref:Gliding motility lipoprotein GldH n=1 Tax=Polaribacter glomeratus TaxID=102 RepID=A0A2S7WIM8_9FLAO|nr:gliding motility lipoprotein GldH [Polaribacter glomeratus]PQJ77142.1 gliding motility lipoprotein GldH [Polaribacter glomeratus]TXD65210.1 gliding motility lipoprotein GldH [Polaribacter glomeratus]
MERIPKKNRGFGFLILFLFLVSCNDKIEFTQYKSVSSSSWQANKNISFEFDVVDTILPKDLFINIRNTNAYPFSNLYVITELNFPNGNKIVDTLQYEMTDETGAFLGKGFAEIKENKLYYKEQKVFPKSGKYLLNIRHAMRKNGAVNVIPFLEGVQDVGLSIEKIK